MVYSTPATCRAGQCVHVGQEKDCAKGCKDGACVEDLCLGVICDSPPVGSCLDETTLGYFQAPGICSEGVCEYLALEETCGFGCQAGACLGDPCLGKNCSAPPASACVDANTLRHYSPQGSCAAGACSYPPQDIACTFGCSAGACLEDPCLGVVCDTPPAQSCTEMMTLRTYQSTGTCTAGQCEYQELTQTCDLGCQGGACLEDPCTGVSCTNSPANYCNGSGVVKYALNGTCSAGACAYKKAAYPCEFGCKAGECQPDPCLGVVCIAPPTVCEAGGTVVTSFTSSCSAGNCFVVGGSTPCEFGCLAGKCNPF